MEVIKAGIRLLLVALCLLVQCPFVRSTPLEIRKEESSIQVYGRGYFVKPILSPRRTFVVVSPNEGRIWLQSTKNKQVRVELPQPKDQLQSALDPISVSPNEEFIVCDVKVCSGVNSVFLYRRVHGLHYKLVGKLRDKANAFYEKKKPGFEGSEFLYFVSWSTGSRYLNFHLIGDHSEVLIRGRYDTVKSVFR